MQSTKFNISSEHINFTTQKTTKLFSSAKHNGLLNLNRTKHPLEAFKQSRVSKDRGEFIIFTHSDLLSDSGQSTVPFFDSQPVAPKPAIPLGGGGFIWKSVGDSGGFIAPVVVPYGYNIVFDELQPELMHEMINNYERNWISENINIIK